MGQAVVFREKGGGGGLLCNGREEGEEWKAKTNRSGVIALHKSWDVGRFGVTYQNGMGKVV